MPRIFNGEDNLFNKWCWRNKTFIVKRMKLDTCHTLLPKINSKWIKYLNTRLETAKILEENIKKSFMILILKITSWI